MKIALVVGAGGPTGGPFIWSALEALEARTGWNPSSADVIVGTSAGAFVAASFSSHVPVDPEAADALRRLATESSQPGLEPTAVTRVASVGRRLAGRIVAVLTPSSRPIAEYNVPAGPFHPGASAVTVMHRSGGRVRHTIATVEDPEAVVRASAAIPGVNGPVPINGELHIDGAVHSANNLDLVDHSEVSLVVVISPMIPATGGSVVSRFHRAQLREELRPWRSSGREALVIMPSDVAHANRREREEFRPAGADAVEAL